MSLRIGLPRAAFWSRTAYRSRGKQRGFLNMHLAAIAARRRGTGPSGGLLGSYTANVWGGYALFQLWSSWTGNLIRVRRSSDSAELDIGQSGGVLDTAALATFVGASDAYIVKWYDQTGAGNDFSQATTAAQPMIVDAGTYTGEALFDGVDDKMITINASGTPTAFTVFFAGRSRVGNTSGAESLLTSNGGSAGGVNMACVRDTTSQADDYVLRCTGGANGSSDTDELPTADGTTYTFKTDRTQGTVATQDKTYINGTLATSIRQNGSVDAGAMSSGTWILACGGGTDFARIATTCVLIYQAAVSDADIASISALVKPGYKVDGLTGNTTSVWGIYSLRRLLSTYAGSAIRVRRSSDNAEQDIGFDATTKMLDIAALLAFIGANSGFVKTYYDQSGAGHDFTQATTTKQPRIVNAGTLDALGIFFNGTAYGMSTSATNGTTSAFTMYFRGKVTTTSVVIMLELGASYDTTSAAHFYRESSHNLDVAHNLTSNSNRAEYRYNINAAGQILAARTDRSQGTAAAQIALYSGGYGQSSASNNNAGTLPSGNYATNSWFLGSRNNSSLFMQGNVDTVVIYEAAHSATTIDRLSRAMGS